MASTAQFRIQHVAQRPSGWRVRTKRSGSHELRIAFPPGPRQTGSGKVLEILHPKGERNPDCELAGKNPAELVIFGNPTKYIAEWPTKYESEHHTASAAIRAAKACNKKFGADPKRDDNYCTVTAVERDGQHVSRQLIWPRRGPLHSNPAELVIFGNPSPRQHKSNHKPGCDCAICKNARGEKHSPGCGCALCRKKPRGKNANWMKVDGVVGKVVETRGTTGSPEYLLETKEGKRVWVKPHYRPRTNPRRNISKSTFNMTAAEAERHLKRLEALSLKIKKGPKRRRNQADETGQAVKLFQTFHGKDPRGIIEKHVSDAMRMEYTALGALEYLVVKNESGDTVKINFQGDGVTLASSPQANQLYFIGGNQNLAPCLDKFTDDASKDFIDLGDALEVQYLARKAQGNFEPVKYYHQFGDEKRGSDLPRAIYDKLRKQVFLAGGEYTIEQPGIIN